MKKTFEKIIAIIVMTCMFLGTELNFNTTKVYATSYNTNLVKNGDGSLSTMLGGENGTTNFTEWTASAGSSSNFIIGDSVAIPGVSVSPNGGNFFDYYPTSAQSDALSQTIDISDMSTYIDKNRVKFDFSGYIKKLKATSSAIIRLEMLGSSNNLIKKYELVNDSTDETDTWQSKSITNTAVEPGTKTLKVSLVASISNADPSTDFIEFDGIDLKLKQVKFTADASKNTVNLSPTTSVMLGTAVTMTAAGDRQAEGGVVIGDERYIPTTWISNDGKSGNFIFNEGTNASNGTYTTTTAGNRTVTASYKKQTWNGTSWDDGVTDTKAVNLTVTALTYTMAAIENQTMAARPEGYVAGTQEIKTIPVMNTGTGSLSSIATSVTGTAFDISQPQLTSLASGAVTQFTIKAKDGLAPGTYTETVTISATGMTNVTFTVTQVVSAAPTYTIASIGNQTMTGLIYGYATGSSEIKTIPVINTGTGSLSSIATSVTGTAFDISQPQLTSLTSGDGTQFTIKAKDGLAPGTYTGTVTVSATGMTNVTFTVTQVVSATPTYTIASINNQTMAAMPEGYVVGTQETKTIHVINTGTGNLSSIATSVTGTAFDISQPQLTSLASGGAGTQFTIKAKDGLAPGTYTETVTISATGMTNVTFTITQVVSAVPVVVPSAITNAANAITNNSATLNGTINANGASTTVTFQYGTTVGYGTSMTASPSCVTGNSSTSVSAALTGLSPNTTYHYRVVGVNSAGTIYGSDYVFTTIVNTNSYTVTFKDYDGSVINTQTISEGQNAIAPTAPTRIGYTFTGWDKAFTNITENKEVIAKYTENGVIIPVPNPTPTDSVTTPSAVTVKIKGTERVGMTLSAELWDEDGSEFTTSVAVTYKWDRLSSKDANDGTTVGTNSTYRLVPSDKGNYIKLMVYCDDEEFGYAITGIIERKSSSNSSGSSSSSSNSSTKVETTTTNNQTTVNNDSTTLLEGWNQTSGFWKYIKNGQLVNGWNLIDGSWYFMDPIGVMQTGWGKYDSKWYFLKDSGAMAIGWQQLNGIWYFLSKDGAMATGWQEINGIWYYFNSDGSMAFNTIIDGCVLDENGAWVY